MTPLLRSVAPVDGAAAARTGTPPRRPRGGLTTPGEVVGNTLELVRRAARRPAPVISGRLASAPVQRDTTWAVGGFRVTWSTGGTPDDPSDDRIEVRDRTGRVVLASRPGAAFVTSDSGIERIAEQRGMFHLAFERRLTADTQLVEAVEQLPDGSLRLRGRVTSADGSNGSPWTMQLRADDDGSLGIDLRRDPDAGLVERSSSHRARLQLTLAREPRERFLGMGEQFTHVEATGRRIEVFNGEHGIGRGLQPVTALADALAGAGGTPTSSYAAMPVVLSTARRLLYLDNTEPTAVDLRDPRTITLEASSDSLRARLITAPTPAGLIQAYTARVGRMPELPEWITSGAIVGLQGGTEVVRRRIAELRAAGTQVAAVWLQDWQGQRTTSAGKQLWWNWELDRDRYPGWEQLRSDWQRDGMRVMTYVNPFLVDVASRPGAERNLYAEARERGFLVQRRDGSPYLIKNTDFSAGLIDLTNPAARTWMRDVLVKQVIGAGSSGWMADYGEALPVDAVLHDGSDPREYHHRYAEEWQRLNRDAIRAAGRDDDVVFFSRSAYTRSPGITRLMWTGDQLHTWDRFDGLASALRAVISSGLSGIAFNHSDVGGYTTIPSPVGRSVRTRELLERWTEFGAFTTVLRTHEGSNPTPNAQVYDDPAARAHFTRMSRVFAAWEPYRRELVREAAATGLPVVRHMWLQYPDDPATVDLVDQYALGPDAIVAPVLQPRARSVRVYLPEGRWQHPLTGQVYESTGGGRWHDVPAPIGTPAVFMRAGSEALRSTVQRLRELQVVAGA